MSEVKQIATRESYGRALVELGKEHENVVVLDADLAAATKTAMFKKEFPDRHFDCGIAEAFPPWALFRLRPALRCLPPDVRLSKSAIPSAIRI